MRGSLGINIRSDASVYCDWDYLNLTNSSSWRAETEEEKNRSKMLAGRRKNLWDEFIKTKKGGE